METPASVAKHPIHAILVPIPIGAWIFALVADLAAGMTGEPAWRHAAYYALGVGVVGALLAAVPGLIDLLSLPSGTARRKGIWHMSLNLAAVAIFGLNFVTRWGDPEHVGSPILTVLGVLLIGVSGWLGGEMVYRGGVGVSATEGEQASTRRETVSGRPADARSR